MLMFNSVVYFLENKHLGFGEYLALVINNDVLRPMFFIKPVNYLVETIILYNIDQEPAIRMANL